MRYDVNKCLITSYTLRLFGILQQLRVVLPDDLISSRNLYNCIGYHVRSVHYLLSLKSGGLRYDIYGKKTEAVTQAESDHAMQQLFKLHNAYMKESRKRKNTMITPAKDVKRRKPQAD